MLQGTSNALRQQVMNNEGMSKIKKKHEDSRITRVKHGLISIFRI